MAGNLVNMGSMLKCNKGMAPSTLICTQAPTVSAVAPGDLTRATTDS